MWRSDTKPTPANVRKRINAAMEALSAAKALAERNGNMPKAIKRIENASAWASDALGHAVAGTRR